MTSARTIDENAIHDLKSTIAFRERLATPRSYFTRNPGITATQEQVAIERERQSYAAKQAALISSLSAGKPLFRTRVELSLARESTRIYFSPAGGVEMTPIDVNDGDDVLVSWAHPRLLHIRDVPPGEKTHFGTACWTVESHAELGHETLRCLCDLVLTGHAFEETKFSKVQWDEGNEPLVIRASELSSEITTVESEKEVEHDVLEPPTPKTKLVLDTVVRTEKGKLIEIPFALDATQWIAMSRHAPAGTILLIGPPGTGKTTIALLRATVLLQSTFDHDETGLRLSDTPILPLRPQRFRVVVVTEHLRSYLKEFLSSPELGLPEAEVVNLRGAFLEHFVRHKTLASWIRGLKFRLSPRRNMISDALTYIKAHPHTLRLCFTHAVGNAASNAGEECRNVVDRIFQRIYDSVERQTLERVLSEKEYRDWQNESSQNGDALAFVDRIGKGKEFERQLRERLEPAQLALGQLRAFLVTWSNRAHSAIGRISDDRHIEWLAPAADDLLLSRFVEEVTAADANPGIRNVLFREIWRELVRLVDPQEVLELVIEDLMRSNCRHVISGSSITDLEAIAALQEWRTTLRGLSPTVENDEEDGDESATLDDLDLDENDTTEDDRDTFAVRKGALTRSDFPLVAAIARAFLASTGNAFREDERYRDVGFKLPDDVARYDHVIIDEGQDFTFAELHLVRSLVENQRTAVTVSGDPHQRMDWRHGVSGLESLLVEPDRTFRIGRNYRQTIEIANWVRKLGDRLYGDTEVPMETSHEHGDSPCLRVISKLKGIVNESAKRIAKWFDDDNPFAAVLLVGFDAGIKTKFANSLATALEADSIHVEKIENGRLIERGRVTIADVPTVKGLEFDGVVVVVSSDACRKLGETGPQAEIVKNMVYVACSRAKRHLAIIAQEGSTVFDSFENNW